MRFYRNYRISDSERLVYAGLFSLALHVSLLFFVRYVQPDRTVSHAYPLQVFLEHQPAEVAQPPAGIPQAGEDSAGKAKIGVQDKNRFAQTTLAAVESEPGNQSRTEIPQGFVSQKILSIDKPQQMQVADRGESTPDLLVMENPETDTHEPPENREGAFAPVPGVAKPEVATIPPVEKLVSSEPIPGEKHEKIVLVEPVQEKPANEIPGRSVEESKPEKIEESKPAQAEERKQARVEEFKPGRAEDAKPARTEAEPKTLPSEGGKPEVFSAKSPGYETSRQPVLGIPLVRRIVLEDEKNPRPGERRKTIGFKEQDFRYAMYIEGLRLKLERIGFLNYPAGVPGESLSGTLSVRISIRADGSLEDFSIVRPSGHAALNAGAEKIVRMSAPFSALPENIRRETDILSITIKWTFSRYRQSFD